MDGSDDAVQRPPSARSPRWTAAACVLLLAVFGLALQRWTAGFDAWTFDARRALRATAGALQAPPLTLLAADGTRFTPWPPGDADAQAPAAWLVDFVYTRCPTVCRTLGSEYQQLQQRLLDDDGAHASQPRLLSISFDVARDELPSLRAYAKAYRADPQRWIVAVPMRAADAERLLRALDVVVLPDGLGGFVHNGAIHLLDRHGRLRAIYDYAQWPQALAAAQALAAPPS